jgi:hypothetical protein
MRTNLTAAKSVSHIFRQVAVALTFAVTAAAATTVAVAENAMRINVDEARVVQLASAPGTVIIGNPLIADAMVHSGNILVILGKNFGTTNVIVLDHDSEEIANLDLNVVTSGNNELSLYRGSGRVTYNCAPLCERELNVGDAQPAFEVTQDQIGKKTGHSSSAVDAPAESE